MSKPEETPTETPETGADTGAPEGGSPSTTNDPAPSESSTPPWGEDFSPERAWRTIQNLRGVEKELREKVGKFEDEQKTEAERIAERLAQAEERAARAERELLVGKVAREKSVPAELVEFLTADTEDGLIAQAESLAKFVTPPAATPTTRRPTPRLREGSEGVEPPAPPSPRSIAERIRRSA